MTTPTYGGASAINNATSGSMALTPISGSIASLPVGSVVLFLVLNKSASVVITCSTPGLTKLGQIDSTTGGAPAGDAGSVSIAAFVRIVDGTEAGSYAFNPVGNPMVGQAFLVTKGAGSGTWDIAVAGGLDVTGGASWSVTTGAIDLKAEDLLVVGSVTPADAYSSGPSAGAIFSAETTTEGSLTFGAATEISEPNTAAGQDLGGMVFRQAVTAGSDATATPTVTATVTGDSLAREYGATIITRFRLVPVAPGVPTALTPTPDVYSADLDWGVPATGDAPDGYRVRVDGGASTDVGNVLTHLFTGLTPVTTYSLEVQAYNAGGSSAWATVNTDTLPEPDVGWYRIELELGSHSWSVEKGDAPAYGPLLPLSMGWEIPDSVDFFPAQAGLTTLRFDVRSTDAGELADVVKGTSVAFRMWVDPDPLADPWQELSGVVTQLDGAPVASAADPDLYDFVTNVYAADDNARLADMWVGYTADWPVEHIEERADRICTEAGLLFDRGIDGGAHGNGMVGWLNTRAGNSPISVLDALRATLKDAADDYDSEPPFEFYGRYVYQYVPADGTVYAHVFRRRMFSSFVITLPGERVDVAGQWTKRPGPAAADWGIVDAETFGTPSSSVPFVRSTSLLDTFSVPGDPTNHSATERDNLGESLLPDGSTALDGWSTRLLVFEASYVAPSPLEDTVRWASFAPPVRPIAVIATPIRDELELNGVDYIAGTLTGCRLVIPAGGRFKLELKLRNELLAGVDLP